MTPDADPDDAIATSDDAIDTPDDAEAIPTPALCVFDFDGTLVDQRGGWLVLQELFGTRDRGKLLSERYRDGEITFQEWCDLNAALLAERGVRRSHVEAAADAVKLTRGAEDVLGVLRRSDCPYGVVSAGVRNLQHVLDPYEPAFRHSNELLFDDRGAIVGADARVGPDGKDEVLEGICREYGVDVTDVFYVGDSHTDVEAFDVAGTSVLFDPDDRIDAAVAEGVDVLIEDRDLARVADLLRRALD